MINSSKRGWGHVGLLALVGASAWLAFAPSATPQSSDPPQYDSSGNLLRPVGFETWVFVGSNLGLAYQGEGKPQHPEFHNVYMSPQAYAEFVKTQTFPDLTVFVIDRLTPKDREAKGIVTAGVYNDQRVGILAAVKNMHRPDKRTKPWAYYVFSMDGNQMPDSAKAELDSTDFEKDSEKEKTCEGCHAVHASRDHVWVQFYPILRNLLH
jgi:hypothetical protein